MTTREPGAREVLTHGLVFSPRSTAFFASSPAAIMTDGLDVFVQLVMAAMTTSPWSSVTSSASARTAVVGRLKRSGIDSDADDGGGAGLRSGPAGLERPAFDAGGSLAGKDWAEASSGPRGENIR